MPTETSFEISETEFNAKYSNDPKGSVIPKVIRRKRDGGDYDYEGGDKEATSIDMINLRRKFSNKYTKNEESLIEKMDAIRNGRHR